MARLHRHPFRHRARPRPRRRRLHRRPRWWLIWLPLLVLFMIWFLNGIAPAFTFEDIADALNVHHLVDYRELAVFALLLIGLVSLIRIWKRPKD